MSQGKVLAFWIFGWEVQLSENSAVQRKGVHLGIGAHYRPAGHFSVFLCSLCCNGHWYHSDKPLWVHDVVLGGTNTTVTNHSEYMMLCTVGGTWMLWHLHTLSVWVCIWFVCAVTGTDATATNYREYQGTWWVCSVVSRTVVWFQKLILFLFCQDFYLQHDRHRCHCDEPRRVLM